MTEKRYLLKNVVNIYHAVICRLSAFCIRMPEDHANPLTGPPSH